MRRTIGYAAMLTATALLVAGAGAAGAADLCDGLLGILRPSHGPQ